MLLTQNCASQTCDDCAWDMALPLAQAGTTVHSNKYLTQHTKDHWGIGKHHVIVVVVAH